ncbi:hypothetical protein H7U32_08135 [Bifidobacterium pullorum subsp. saeculare]|uniref:Uncharacterized protein n=1 Tax=Bifidobacterium pullorum subsp. saeculare TaxID=78257 RepID=A0A938WZP3_9BIFI|nr:hypothetical protein [Bifidobacterium pullorum]MBM6700259.1 hypothetical protein [Bifidobacterium pullorum subsp. saeculare]
MSNKEGADGFTSREMRYLRLLPAVERVSRKRITYAEWFKYECMRKYAAGGSPVRIFREAGLDPAVIGYKRVERCFARWRDSVDVEALLNGDLEAPARPDLPEDGAGEPSASAGNDSAGAGSAPAGKGHATGRHGDDVRRLIIVQQARRIEALEHDNQHLRAAIRELEQDGRDAA